MSCMVLNVPFTLPPLPNRKISLSSTREIAKSSSGGWNSSFPSLQLTVPNCQRFHLKKKPLTVVQAAWTRRSKSESAKNPRKKSWKQRTDKYMKPFLLDVFISNKYIHAKVMHRVTSKVVSVATTNSKDLRNTLPSLTDLDACRTIGKLIAERSKEADVYAISYEPRKGERVEGKLGIILDTIKENDIAFV
ncbi:uncharacterized protein LOC131055073 [Cryptomeria japonica]|uniref:uncharacterized protein LOC131055073 n=1 Tax=Cryptomeria japonica TaxID=3369 RepID=UPI0027DA8979|nr:uncharacterized protein LOC131055073 [Cryptomeria japonica]XP_057845695.2 uncharacterized protein LOC131055073 [Cryptomeria japonica]XP_057845696.2 uncharacterized protein LOC131055073 [Cryptomeria japonica]XP_057845697.2 uncharacterized protein LOC131055073 [Cryptomeria japonica]